MKQSAYRYIGLLDLALVGVFLAIFGPGAVVHRPLLLGMALAGVTLVVAGSVAAVTVGQVALTWRHFIGISYGVFGSVWPASFGLELLRGAATDADIALFVVATVGAFSLLYHGYNVLRGERSADIEADVERVIGT